jgi:uncharacterized protein (TIGR01244 family)
MTEFRRVTDDFSVAYQLAPEDMAQAARDGFRLVINNRPDGEDPSQPQGPAMKAAAEQAGLAYVYLPVVGRPTESVAQAVREAAEAAGGPVLAYCRSGTRSINTWALGQALAGKKDREELIALGRQAGYDLTAILG